MKFTNKDVKYKDIIGKIISEVWINQDKTILALKMSNNKIIGLKTEGDCCSESWIEHVDMPYIFSYENPLELKVLSVEETEIGEVIPTRQDRDILYGIKMGMISLKGTYERKEELCIEFRNSSNGYYGGWIEIEPLDDLSGFVRLTGDM